MVRILAGTLLEVGLRRRTVAQTAALVAVPSGADGAAAPVTSTPPTRAQAGPTLPPDGLCLDHVEYNHVRIRTRSNG